MLNTKLLVQGMMWGIALLAMNNASADDSSIIDFLNENEASSLEQKAKKSNLIPQKKSPNSNVIEQNSNKSLQNPVKKDGLKIDKIKQRKTHYGIGYEYRKSMRDQIQRTERVVRPEKTQRPERVERPERINRPERIERPDRPSRH